MYNFHWNGKGDKIKREEIINGGLKTIDTESFNNAL